MNYNLITVLLLVACCYANKDEIKNLPGLETQPAFKQYSGYLQGSTDNIQLHYWFVEADTKGNSADLPLVLWLNGGPGCSSMEGMLAENGPFNVQKGDKLSVNEYSWNKVANMLYIEAPAGVGYSYAKDGNVTTDDDLTAYNNLMALESFFLKYPYYKFSDFYIAGESYAGVYVPTLALYMSKFSVINLKGILVGNGLTSYDFNDNSLMYFANYHGLVERETWKKMLESCCDDADKEMCRFSKPRSDACESYMGEIDSTINSGLNIYNLLQGCAGGVTETDKTSIPSYPFAAGSLLRSVDSIRKKKDFAISKKKLLSKVQPWLRGKLAIPCVDDSILTSYLQNETVRAALHIKAGLGPFEICSTEVYERYKRTYLDLSETVKNLLENGKKVWFYNGDVDMACNFIGQEWFVDQLSLPEAEKSHSWLYTETDGTKQIGGFAKVFNSHSNPEIKLTYLTVKGAGHMVPTDKPIQALHIFKSFLNLNDL